MSLEINGNRLLESIRSFGEIGAEPGGGSMRICGSDVDKECRDELVRRMRNLGLEVRVDRIGNIFGGTKGYLDKGAEPVMVGSHIDSVVNGGNLDGVLGVLAGLEVLAVLQEKGVACSRPIVVAAFTNEEGVRFQPDMMGSLVFAGGMRTADALAATDDSGVTLGEELSRIGYAGGPLPDGMRPGAFIELHIEQGPVLESKNLRIGIVEKVQGISWTEISITGQANHAGTTPMNLRRDAGVAASAIARGIHEFATQVGGDQVATVGKIECRPNAINVVPAFVRMTVDLRNTDNRKLEAAEAALDRLIDEARRSQGVAIQSRRLVRFDPVDFDQGVLGLIEETVTEHALPFRRMSSGAGHDAQMLARICPTAMIFVPSIGGVSHNPREETSPEDIVDGARILGATVLRLCSDPTIGTAGWKAADSNSRV